MGDYSDGSDCWDNSDFSDGSDISNQTSWTARTTLRGQSSPSCPRSPLNLKQSPGRLFLPGDCVKKGGYLLSRIALQYHRRKRA